MKYFFTEKLTNSSLEKKIFFTEKLLFKQMLDRIQARYIICIISMKYDFFN